MSRHSLLLVFALAATASVAATAQRIAPADLSGERTAVMEAFRQAERGALSVQDVARIADHPLRGWVEATALRKRITTAGTGEVRDALRRHDGTPAADWLRGPLSPLLDQQLATGAAFAEGWFDRPVRRWFVAKLRQRAASRSAKAPAAAEPKSGAAFAD